MNRRAAFSAMIVTTVLILTAILSFALSAGSPAVAAPAPAPEAAPASHYFGTAYVSNTPMTANANPITTGAKNWLYYGRADFYVVSTYPVSVSYQSSPDAVNWYDTTTLVLGAFTSYGYVTATHGTYYRLILTPAATNTVVYTPTIRAVYRGN